MTTASFRQRLASLRSQASMLRNSARSGTTTMDFLACLDSVIEDIDRISDGQAFYEQLVQNSPTIVFSRKTTSEMLAYVSPNVERATGYPRASFLEQPRFWAAHVHPEDLARFNERWARVVAQQAEHLIVEYRFLCQDGLYRWFYEQDCFIYDQVGDVVEVIGYGLDISDRKQTEEALRESEERYRRLVELSPEAIAIYSAGTLVYINPAGLHLAGASTPDVLIGRSISDFVPQEWCATLVAAMPNNDMMTSVAGGIEVAFTRLDGQIRYVEALAAPITYQGHSATQVFMRDITERKHAEAALQAQAHLLNVIDKAVIATDLDGQITFWNHFAARLYGCEAEAVLSRNLFEVTLAEPPPGHTGEVMEQLRGGESWSGELLMRRCAGTTFPALVTHSPIRGEQGQMLGFVTVVSDITEQKWAEELIERRMHQRTVIAELGQTALVTTELQAFLDETVGLLARTLEVDFCMVQELLPEGTEFVLRAGAGWPDGRVGCSTAGTGHASQAGYTLLMNRPVIVQDLPSETRFAAPFLREHGVISGMSVIIRGPERPFGVLGVHVTSPRSFPPQDVNFLQMVANLIGIVVERSYAQAAIKASEERFRMLVENSSDTITVLDQDGTVRFTSASTKHMLGYTPEERQGESAFDLVHPDDLPALHHMFDQALAHPGVTMTGSYQAHHKDGSWRVLESTAINQIHPAVGGVVISTRDITERRRSEVALRRYAERLQLLRTIDEAILALQPPETIAQHALQFIRQLSPCTLAGITLLEAEGHDVVLLAADLGYAAWLKDGCRVLMHDPDIRARLEAGQPCLYNDLEALESPPAALQALHAAGVRSYLIAPLLSSTGLIGVLNVGADTPGAFTTEHLEIAREVAATLAVAVQNSRLYAAERRAREIADILRTASLALTESLDLPDVLQTLLVQLERLVPYDSANVMLLDSVGQFTFLAGRGYERWSAGVELPRISVDPQQHEIFQAILRTRQSMMIPETRGYSGWERWPSTDHVRSFLGVPLLVADRVIGVFCVDKAEPHFFTSEHIRLAETLAVDGAIAIQHSRLFEQVRVGRERLEHLSQQLLQVQEAERRQIARELHDEIGQALTALKINMQALQRVLSEEAMVRRVDESIAIIDQTLRQVRDLSLQLRPSLLDDLGLGSALRWYVTRLAERTGIEGKVTIENSESRYGPEIETTGFRVAQEALTNVVRHAQAKHIWVGLRHTLKELELVVRDDGRGFDVAATHERAVHGQSLGILGMQERILLAGGELEITSTPGQGTEVRARLPLDPSLRHIERRGKRRE